MHTLAIANQKGGVGKTTLAALLAFYLSEQPQGRVVAIDLDAQANLSTTLRQHRLEVATSALFADRALSLPAVRPALGLFHAERVLANLELGAGGEQRQRVRTFVAQVASLAPEFDWCVVDTPPTAGLRMVSALAAADYVVVPIELERYSRDGVKAMLQMILGVRADYNPRLKLLGLLPNRVMRAQPRQRESLADVVRHYADYLLPGGVAISTRSAIPRALDEGVPVWRLPRNVGQEASTEVLRAFDAMVASIAPATAAAEVPA